MTTQKKLLIYKILIFLFAFIVAFMPVTVSRSREVNSRVIVEILGIDGGDEISVTAQYVMPMSKQGETSKDTVTVKGKTLGEAVESLSTALGRRAELGHCSMVIVGSDATPDVLSTLLTVTDVTADTALAAAEDKAEELVGKVTDFMKKTGATDADFIAYSAKNSHTATNTLLSFLCDIGSVSHCSFIPVVTMLESEGGSGENSGGSSSGGGGESSGGGQGGGSSGGDSQSGNGMKVEKLALFTESGRCGILEKEAARGVAWVSSPIDKGVLTADVEVDGRTIKDVTARLLNKHVKIQSDAKKGTAKIKVCAEIEPRGDKFNELDANNSAEASMAIRQSFADSIKKELETAYEKSSELGCDPLFLDKEFYRHHPDYYETEYSKDNIAVTFEAEVSIK